MTGINICVIGWPISHSRSPLIHGYWLDKYDIDGSYRRLPVKPDNLPELIARMRAGEFAGANVTLPHKEAVFGLVDSADSVARTLRAINTIYVEDGHVKGTNTDGYGYLANLRETCPHWLPNAGPATVLGAGGAARAIVHALHNAGVPDLRIVNRNIDRARDLAADLCPSASTVSWDDLDTLLPDTHLLVNTTSLGMVGMPPLTVDVARLPAGAVVSDIVYMPLQTDLIAAALQHGLDAVGGLGMLLHQAVPGFRKWFGVTPQVTRELQALVVKDVESS